VHGFATSARLKAKKALDEKLFSTACVQRVVSAATLLEGLGFLNTTHAEKKATLPSAQPR